MYRCTKTFKRPSLIKKNKRNKIDLQALGVPNSKKSNSKPKDRLKKGKNIYQIKSFSFLIVNTHFYVSFEEGNF